MSNVLQNNSEYSQVNGKPMNDELVYIAKMSS